MLSITSCMAIRPTLYPTPPSQLGAAKEGSVMRGDFIHRYKQIHIYIYKY